MWACLPAHPRRFLDQPYLSIAISAGTKVVATIGPACQDVGVLCDMLNAGMVGVRLDLAKGTLQFHQRSLDNLQKVWAGVWTRVWMKLCVQ